MKEKFYLSCLLASKICHDLIGASSSLSFSMEMLGESDEELNKDALALSAKSAAVLVNRLKYFRSAFGISSLGHEESLVSKVKELITELSKEKDIYINWLVKYDNIIDKGLNNINVKLLLNIYLLLFNAIPKSATIDIIAVNINHEEIAVMLTLKGYKIRLGQNIIDIINGNAEIEDINPRNINAYFTNFLRQEADSRIEINNTNDNEGLKLAFTMKKA